MFRRFLQVVLAGLVAVLFGSLSRLWRFETIRKPKDQPLQAPVIYAHWHGDELLLIGRFVGSRMAILVSRSKDGELLARIMKWFRFRIVRGSSSRGGAGGLKGLIDVVLKERRDASLAVDGPRGPIFQVKPGVLKLAQETGCALIPGASAASRRFVFHRAWNRCYLPLPFSRCIIVYGDPMYVPQDLSDEEFEGLRLQLEQTMLRLKEEAEAQFERTFSNAEKQLQTAGA